MINEEKVLRMTKMAIYEEHGGKRDKAVAGFFRSDYLGMHLVISFLLMTAAFLASLVVWLCFSFEEVMGNIYTMDLVGLGRRMLLWYTAALGLYLAATWAVYRNRYRKARKRLNLFLAYLRRTEALQGKPDNGRDCV